MVLHGLGARTLTNGSYPLTAADFYDPNSHPVPGHVLIAAPFAGPGMAVNSTVSSHSPALRDYIRDQLNLSGSSPYAALRLSPSKSLGCEAGCRFVCQLERYSFSTATLSLTIAVRDGPVLQYRVFTPPGTGPDGSAGTAERVGARDLPPRDDIPAGGRAGNASDPQYRKPSELGVDNSTSRNAPHELSVSRIVPPEFNGNKEGVCIVPLLSLRDERRSTERYLESARRILRNIALRSIRMQRPSASVKTVVIQLKFSTWKQHFASKEEMTTFLHDKAFEEVHLNIETDGEPEEPNEIRDSNCKWVAFVRLDADDALKTDYFNYIGDQLIPNVLERKFHNSDYLGAVVASPCLPVLYFAFGHCDILDPCPDKYMPYSGLTVGQTRIYRRDVYERLTFREATQGGNHAYVIERVRNEVMRQFMNVTDYRSEVVDKRGNLEYRRTDEEATAVKMIHVSKFGIYLQTPLSGHFPWREIKKKPLCTHEKQQEISKFYEHSTDLSFVFDRNNTESLSIMDVCKSHRFFKKYQAALMRKYKTCERVAKAWDLHVANGNAL